LISKRYTIVVADRRSGVVRRCTISLLPTAAVIVSLLTFPMLIGLGARWSALSEIRELTASNIALQMENDNFREATGQLASQISTLLQAVDDIGVRATVDPAAGSAMEKLPLAVKSRAMGGGTAAAAFAPVLSSAFGSPDSAFGVLRDILGAIESRLDSVRHGVERRRELAASTPSIWPVTGWLSSGYGGRRDPFSGRSDFHPGLDISAPYGQAVRAPADGLVSSAGANGNYGNLIVIDHGFGIITKYGHLSRIGVIAGHQVNRGDVIGYVGSTGRSTSPHLHYEIWMNGHLTNPLKLLAGR
jgi:murein DD-endopeptidase MepM/ murein hydrolase activator NlpD